MYKELIYPWHKQVFDYVHDHSDLKTFLHSCGSIYDIIPHLIEAGLDILNPVQTQCTDMEADKLKASYGKDLVFWGGGIDTQNALAFSDEKTVRDMVKRNCEILMKGGGFVFTPIHNMLPGIPPENIVGMYDEVNSIQY
jgi:uroporphyrinogen decarboxylase